MMEIIDIFAFGATGDQNADVEKNPKKLLRKLQLTNEILFLTATKTHF